MKNKSVKRLDEKKRLEATRKKQYEQSMKYTRYIYIRYFLAVLCFSNVYWFASLLMTPTGVLIVPALMIALVLIPYFTMLKLQNNPDASAKHIVQFFQLNMIVTAFEIGMVWINCHFFFPYVQATVMNQMILTVILGGSILLSFLSMKQIDRIERNQDTISKRLADLKEYTI